MTTVVYWVIVGFLALSVLATVDAIGKPREPISTTLAIVCLFATGLLIAGITYLRWNA